MGTWFVCARCGCKWEGRVPCPGHSKYKWKTEELTPDETLLCGPNLTVDAIAECLGRIVLIQRAKKGKPTGLWALPGGFVNYRERLADAVVRETKEETGLDLLAPRLFWIYDDPERDKNPDADKDREEGRNNVSVVYSSTACGILEPLPQHKDEVAAIRCCTREEIVERHFGKVAVIDRDTPTLWLGPRVKPSTCEDAKFEVAFDHGTILEDYLFGRRRLLA